MSDKTPSPQSVVVPVETRECARLLVQELTPDQGQSAGRAFGLAVSLQAMLADAPAPSSLAGGEDVQKRVERIVFEDFFGSPVAGSKERLAKALIREFGLAALSPEAPARDGVPEDVRRLVIAARNVAFEDPTQSELRALDIASEAFASRVPWDDEPDALTPRHEAPAEPCFECGSTERTGTACKPCNPEITDPNFGHEAPAEGAGELIGAAESIHAAALIYEDQALLDDAEIVLKHLRARSSAPEARS